MTTLVLSPTISASIATSQPLVTSTWASRNTRTEPLATWEPERRARMRPNRDFSRRTRVGTGSLLTWASRDFPSSSRYHKMFGCNPWVNYYVDIIPKPESSSTRIISSSRFLGDLLMTEWTVLSSVDFASLLKTTMTDVRGNRRGYCFIKQLQWTRE